MKSVRQLGLVSGSLLCVLLCAGVLSAHGPQSSYQVSRTRTAPASVAVEAMARGDFEQARPLLAGSANDANAALLRPFADLLTRYDTLVASLSAARQEAYRKHVTEFEQKLAEANWRRDLLQASRQIELKNDKKTKLEDEFDRERNENLLAALASLINAWSVADKMDMPFDVDARKQAALIGECLEIAARLEQQDKGLDAYTKVYGLLEVFDRKKYEYTDLHDQLQRKVTLESTYLPDPNTEGVTWSDRRRNIDLEMVYRSLAVLEYGFVEKPDFQKMCLKGLEYCRILAQTPKLTASFDQLEDQEKVASFVETLEKLGGNVKEIDAAKFDSRQVLAVIERLLLINNLTIDLPPEVVLAEFTEGAYGETDSYTYVIWPYDVDEFRKSMTNEFSGVGVVIVKDEDGVLKADSLVSYDTPAYRAGLDAGDRILKVGGRETRDITTEKAVKLITGPDGTDVILTVERAGWSEPREFTVERKQVAVPTVRGLCRDVNGKWQYFADTESGIGYIQLTHFSGDTASSLRAAIKQLQGQGMRALALDLRNNSGGYLSGAIDVVDTFISKGRIVSSRGRAGQEEDVKFATVESTVDETLPLVVLVNSISASASEIVSGALKDNQRAILIGTRTYGKGSVQTIQPLGMTNAQMKMTIAHYYLPGGRCVHRDPKDLDNEDYGVEPHITLELTGEQFTVYAKTQREAGTLHRDDLPAEERLWKVYAPRDIVATDPQLEMALLVLQAQLLRNDPVVVAN